ncbi:MAG: alanine racemase [Rhodospirillales bacterium]|nr:alanine racemase [Rhodospirillales bacterium]
MAAREKSADLAIVADSEAGIDALASLAKRDRPISVLVDIDMGQTRTGVTDPAATVRVAARVADEPSLRYRGVQAYYGHLQHVPALAERLEKVREKWAQLATFIDTRPGRHLAAERYGAAGLAPEIISGGGTGTHHLDFEQGPFTEVQAGSYHFMDKQYGAVELAPGGSPFRTPLTVAGRVVSTV